MGDLPEGLVYETLNVTKQSRVRWFHRIFSPTLAFHLVPHQQGDQSKVGKRKM